MSVKEKMTAIAANIRSKTGKTEPLNLDEIANGVNEVYEAGRKQEWSDFWDEYQTNGKRTNYGYAFTGTMASTPQIGWTDKTFKPKYDIKPKDANRMFHGCAITNLKQILEEQGVTLDMSDCTNASLMFGFATKITHIPELNFSSGTGTDCVTVLFSYCYALESVDKIIFPQENSFALTSFFNSCEKLKEVRFEGGICRSLSCSVSPLTVESMVSIINHLKNYAGTENAGKYTLTLKDTCKTLMAQQGVMDELGGKTYDAYIADIGWNLA